MDAVDRQPDRLSQGEWLEPQEVAEQRLAVGSEDRFGVELAADHRKLHVAERHDDPVPRARGNLEVLGERTPVHDQRVIAAGVQRPWRAAKEGAAVVDDLLRLSVHRLSCAHHLPPERLPDALVPEAHAEDGHHALRPGKSVQPASAGDQLQADPGLVRRAGARREHQPLRPAGEDGRGALAIAAQHLHRSAELAEALHEVEGERVVVVDDEDARLHATAFPATAPYAAPTEARTFARTSRHSAAGSLSATIPAPACANSRPWLRNRVRMAMASCMSPAPENHPTAPP